MNRVTDCLYAAQCRSRGIGEWLKRLFCGHGRSCPASSADFHSVWSGLLSSERLTIFKLDRPRKKTQPLVTSLELWKRKKHLPFKQKKYGWMRTHSHEKIYKLQNIPFGGDHFYFPFLFYFTSFFLYFFLFLHFFFIYYTPLKS